MYHLAGGFWHETTIVLKHSPKEASDASDSWINMIEFNKSTSQKWMFLVRTPANAYDF